MTLEPSRQPPPMSGESMSSVEGSRVRTSVLRTTVPMGWKESGAVCGSSTNASFAYFDRSTWSLRTSQHLLFEDLKLFSAALPPAGSMRSGRLFRQKSWARRTSENEFSLWPTPQASDAKRMRFSRDAHLKQQARNRRLGFGAGPAGLNVVAHCQIEFDGYPTAEFVEWLMGFPVTWTDTRDLATPSSRKLASGSADAS